MPSNPEPEMDMRADVPPMPQQGEGMPTEEPAQGMPPGDGQMPPEEPDNEFDTDFDAGVEADEQDDPKKYIQQLTGKLSQSLHSYNQSLPQPDADLAKYVAGMIIKQTTDGLSPEDTNEILKKVKTDEEGSEEAPENEEMTDDDGGMPTGEDEMPDQEGQPQQFRESVNREGRLSLDELYDGIMNGDDEEEMPTKVSNIGYRKKPYTSPNFR